MLSDNFKLVCGANKVTTWHKAASVITVNILWHAAVFIVEKRTSIYNLKVSFLGHLSLIYQIFYQGYCSIAEDDYVFDIVFSCLQVIRLTPFDRERKQAEQHAEAEGEA